MKTRKLSRIVLGGLLLVLCLCLLTQAGITPASAAPAPLPEVGNKFLQENLEKFPNMFDYEKNQTKPIFSNANDRVIQEEVWIEVPVDTDFDGQRDLQRVQIRRPIETLPENGGLKTPVIATLTPYVGQTMTGWSAYANQPDNGLVDQGPAATRFHNTRFIDGDQILGPEGDLSYQALRALTDKRVGKGADAHVARYKDLLADGMLKATEYTAQQKADYPWLPEARTPQGKQFNGTPISSFSGGAGPWTAATYIPRGYAFVHVAILGSANGQGILQYGAYEESLCAAAVVDWLNGRIRAYTDPKGTLEVEAYWATGEVAASGTSYGGTLPIAAAVTGVEGLRTIIPGAPVTNAYNYFRENGTNYFPGDGNRGEDIPATTHYCFGRGWSTTSPVRPTNEIWQTWWDWQWHLRTEGNPETGDFNSFWDERNPLSFGYDMRKDLGVIMGHGFNDSNVKFRNTALFNEMLKYYGVEVIKGVYTQGGHALNMNIAGSTFNNESNMIEWTDHYLYGVDNGITDRTPDYQIQDNKGWTTHDTWPAYTGYQKFYPTGGRADALSEAPQPNSTTATFKDVLTTTLTRPTYNYDTMAKPAGAPEEGYRASIKKHAGQGTNLDNNACNRWRNWIVGGYDSTTAFGNNSTRLATASAALTANFSTTKEVEDRLLYTMDIPEDFTISGTVAMTAKVAASQDAGIISAMIVEWGSTVKIVALGSVDVRNPNPEATLSFDVPGLANPSKGGNWHANYLFQSADIVPYGTATPAAANFNSYTWEMDITEYKFTAGNKLGLIIFGSDPVFTYLPKFGVANPPEFTVELGAGTYLSLPVVDATYTVEFLDEQGNLIEAQKVAYGEAATPPAAPAREGYHFVGWDVDFSNVTDYLVVTALYEINVYTVSFVDWDGALLGEQQVEHGSAAIVPADPLRADWIFAGWDADFSYITDDLTVKALYDPTVISVTPSAYVEKLSGNKNNLTITVTELWSDGTKVPITKTFSINNNAADTYTVGGYQVYVDTKGNTQIRECYITE